VNWRWPHPVRPGSSNSNACSARLRLSFATTQCGSEVPPRTFLRAERGVGTRSTQRTRFDQIRWSCSDDRNWRQVSDRSHGPANRIRLPSSHDNPYSMWTTGELNPDLLVAGQASFRWTSSPNRSNTKQCPRPRYRTGQVGLMRADRTPATPGKKVNG
jgi:hypothetical protein